MGFSCLKVGQITRECKVILCHTSSAIYLSLLKLNLGCTNAFLEINYKAAVEQHHSIKTWFVAMRHPSTWLGDASELKCML